MALAQIYSAIPADIITAARWNNEFGNIYTNGTDVAFPLTKAVSFAGYTATLDVAGVSTLTSPASAGFLFTVGAKSGTPGPNGNLGTFSASTFTDTGTAASGTAALWCGLSVRQPTLAATALTVSTTVAASVYIEGAPVASTNETIKGPFALYAGGGFIGGAAGSDIVSASSIAVTSNFSTVTGTVTISAISTVLPAGTIFKLRFTGTGLNLTYNATSMITPWAVDYRTVPNEVLEFVSLGSGNYTFYTLNGPKERVGVTIEDNSASVPAGYLAEDGAAVSRTTYSGLFARVGTTFGTGDGATTFNTPNSQGRRVVNAGTAVYAATCAAASVSVGGDTFTITSQTALYTACPVVLTTTGGAPGNTTAGVTYYIIRTSDTVVQIATSEANARAGTQVNISTQGTGTHTLTATFDAKTLGTQPGEGDSHRMLKEEIQSHVHGNLRLNAAGGAIEAFQGTSTASTTTDVFTSANTGGTSTSNFNTANAEIVKAKYIRF